MRSLTKNKRIFFGNALALLLGGCLVSEAPVLDDRTGDAAPIRLGQYVGCPLDGKNGAPSQDCSTYDVVRDGGAYKFMDALGKESPVRIHFKRVGRGGFAAQADGGDGFVYYYAHVKNRSQFSLLMMMCGALPEDRRIRLIGEGHLSAEDDDFETCNVETRRGLIDAAKAYHRAAADLSDPIKVEFRFLEGSEQ